MCKSRQSQYRSKGSVIVLVVFAVVILAAMGVGLIRLGLHSRLFAIRSAQQIQARTAADAGLTKAVFMMNERLRAKAWSNPTLPWATNEGLPNCNATFSYKINANSINSNKDFRIQSIGTAVQVTKTVSADIGLKGLFDYAILTKEVLTLKSDMLIDGYNSLDAADTDADVKIGTISILPDHIDLKNGVVVNGDVFVGVDGNPDTVIKDTGGTTGNRDAMIEEPPFPKITPPSLPDKGSLLVKATTLTIGPADSGKYTSVLIDYNTEGLGILEVTGGEVVMHVTGDIILRKDCEIIVAADATLTLYVDGDIKCWLNSSIGYQGSPQEPQHLKLYGTGSGAQTFDIKAKSHWSGVIYAPNADCRLFAKGNGYGSFVSNSFEYKANGDCYYDEALRDVDIDDEGVRFIIKRWREY